MNTVDCQLKVFIFFRFFTTKPIKNRHGAQPKICRAGITRIRAWPQQLAGGACNGITPAGGV